MPQLLALQSASVVLAENTRTESELGASTAFKVKQVILVLTSATRVIIWKVTLLEELATISASTAGQDLRPTKAWKFTIALLVR